MKEASIGDQIRDFLKQQGAALVGFADLGPVPAEAREGLPRAITIGVALDPGIVAGIREGPTPGYAAEYDHVNQELGRLALAAVAFLKERGFNASGGPATLHALDWATLATPLPHKTAATLSGLGWIGKCALLVTEELGSAVRLNTVLTDAPLDVGQPVKESRCGECTRCLVVCPARAPTGREWHAGMARPDFFDAHACGRHTRENAKLPGIGRTICGLCIAACPWTLRYLSLPAQVLPQRDHLFDVPVRGQDVTDIEDGAAAQ
jgi:epoxyqueuosine reductase